MFNYVWIMSLVEGVIDRMDIEGLNKNLTCYKTLKIGLFFKSLKKKPIDNVFDLKYHKVIRVNRKKNP